MIRDNPMQRRWSFHYAIWLLSLIVVFAAPIRGQFASTVIEESFGTWYQWPASEGGNDHWYGVIRVMLETAKGEEFASAWGGHLASFGDAKERDFLSRIVTNRFYTAPYATALVAPAGQTWHWTDGTTFDANLLPSVYANFTNGACCTARMTFTPFGNMQNFPEGVLSAALFEITTRPSELLPYITEVKILNREIWSPGLARFAAPAFGPGALSYQWKVGGVPIAGAISNTFELQISTVTTGQVSVAVSNSNGMVESEAIELPIVPVVFTAPNMIWKQWTGAQGGNDHWYGLRQHFGRSSSYFQATEFAKRLGADIVTLQTQAEAKRLIEFSQPNFSEVWLGIVTNSGGELVWVDGSALTDTNWAAIQPNASNPEANYAVLNDFIEDYSGRWIRTTADYPIQVTIMERTNSPAEIKPLILGENVSLRMSVGATNTVELDVIAGPPAYYQWFFEDKRLEGETNLALRFHPQATSDSGNYYLVVSNSFSVTWSNPVQLTVTQPQAITVHAERFGSQLLLDFEHAEDVELIALEYSEDLVSWKTAGQFVPSLYEISPGHYRISTDFYGSEALPRFYRLQRFP
jgi:hypothetical protein